MSLQVAEGYSYQFINVLKFINSWTQIEKCIKLGVKYQGQIVWNWFRLHLGWSRLILLYRYNSSRCMLCRNIIGHFSLQYQLVGKTHSLLKVCISRLIYWWFKNLLKERSLFTVQPFAEKIVETCMFNLNY